MKEGGKKDHSQGMKADPAGLKAGAGGLDHHSEHHMSALGETSIKQVDGGVRYISIKKIHSTK